LENGKGSNRKKSRAFRRAGIADKNLRIRGISRESINRSEIKRLLNLKA